jgi:Outer membrane protein beta-barrel domain
MKTNKISWVFDGFNIKKATNLLFCACLCAISAFSQDKIKKNNPAGGLLVGVNMIEFYNANDALLTLPFKKPTLQWQAGIAADVVNTKKYSLKYELKYINKGANETFADNLSTTIDSKAHLSYAQLNFFPIIYKPLGNPNFNPYIALGGYYAYLVKAKYQLSVNNLPFTTDEVALKNTIKQDYGLDLSIGLYLKSISLEYRLEAGLPYVLDQQQTFSSIKNKSHSIVLIIR